MQDCSIFWPWFVLVWLERDSDTEGERGREEDREEAQPEPSDSL